MIPQKIDPLNSFEGPYREALSASEFIDQQDISEDERRVRTATHEHNGQDAPQVHVASLVGLLSVVSAVPTEAPRTLFEQIVIYSNAGTRRLYVYVTDSAGTGAWRYTVLT